MNKNILVIVLLVVAAAVAGVFLMKKDKAPVVDKVTPSEQISDKEKEVANQIGDEIGDKIKEISDKLAKGEITKEEANAQMKEVTLNSKAVQEQMAAQKESLPKAMKVTKMFRKCLGTAGTAAAAKTCYEKANKEADKLGLNDNIPEEEKKMPTELEKWPDGKKEFLSGMDKTLVRLEKVQKCFDISDMKEAMDCMDKMAMEEAAQPAQ